MVTAGVSLPLGSCPGASLPRVVHRCLEGAWRPLAEEIGCRCSLGPVSEW
ncbi:hypothetical protein HMPREF9056_00124 [Actinomyces sp. oral taxon 170 str. F0386]|nr:hypothetical protein HMPREF9056_00124 [Actinomyces sp. oral taxon 170 str. F0386]